MSKVREYLNKYLKEASGPQPATIKYADLNDKARVKVLEAIQESSDGLLDMNDQQTKNEIESMLFNGKNGEPAYTFCYINGLEILESIR